MNPSHTKCELCGFEAKDVVHKKDGFNIVKCPCGLVYTNPRLDERSTENMYEDELKDYEYYMRSIVCDEKTFDKRLWLIERKFKPQPILDMGAGTGTFIKIACKRGWNAEGVEINRRSFRFAVHNKCRMHKSVPRDKKFGVVNMSDYLEHTHHPVKTLQKMHNILLPGGAIVISVPNWSNPITRMFQLKPMQHLFYFTKNTLIKTMEKAGFEVVYCRTTSRYRALENIHLGSTFRQSSLKHTFKLLTTMKLIYFIRLLANNLHDDILAVGIKKLNRMV